MRAGRMAIVALLAFTTGCGTAADGGNVDLDVATWVNTDQSGMFDSALLEGAFAIESDCLVVESDGERFVPVFPRTPVDIQAYAMDGKYGLGGRGGLPSTTEHNVPASCEHLGYDYWTIGP